MDNFHDKTPSKLFAKILACLSLSFAVISPTTFAGNLSANNSALTAEIDTLLNDGTTGGVYGFRLKKVNGPQLANQNANYIFYPASTIKVLHHVHAMRWIQANGFTKSLTPINVYYLSCSATNLAAKIPLATVLNDMMFKSDNQKTNAIQDWFDQAAINTTAHKVVGLSLDTQLHHKFGCGGPTNIPANQMTLADITLLYEKLAQGWLLKPQYQTLFERLMRNETNSNIFSSVIADEADSLGLTASQEFKFNQDYALAYKAGNIPASTDGTLYYSRAGYVTLPKNTCSGIVKNKFVFSMFIDQADSVDVGLDLTTVRELLRDQIRVALKSYKIVGPATCLKVAP